MRKLTCLLLASLMSALSALRADPSVAAGPGDQLSGPELHSFGDAAYERNCVSMAKYYYAYVQKFPGTLRQIDLDRLLQRISDCEAMQAPGFGATFRRAPGPNDGNASVTGTFRPPYGRSDGTAPFSRREAACEAYANTAIAQSLGQSKLSCGQSGDRWSLDPTRHYDWCMSSGVPAGAVRSELNARAQVLDQCAYNWPQPTPARLAPR
jgi:hypothetical protein